MAGPQRLRECFVLNSRSAARGTDLSRDLEFSLHDPSTLMRDVYVAHLISKANSLSTTVSRSCVQTLRALERFKAPSVEAEDLSCLYSITVVFPWIPMPVTLICQLLPRLAEGDVTTRSPREHLTRGVCPQEWIDAYQRMGFVALSGEQPDDTACIRSVTCLFSSSRRSTPQEQDLITRVFHEALNAIDEDKMCLTDEVYLSLCDDIATLKRLVDETTRTITRPKRFHVYFQAFDVQMELICQQVTARGTCVYGMTPSQILLKGLYLPQWVRAYEEENIVSFQEGGVWTIVRRVEVVH